MSRSQVHKNYVFSWRGVYTPYSACMCLRHCSISLDTYACESHKFSNISPLYSIITVFDIIPPGSHNPAGIPGLEIPQSRIGLDWAGFNQYRLSGRQFYRSKDPTNNINVGLRKRVRDWNPYLWGKKFRPLKINLDRRHIATVYNSNLAMLTHFASAVRRRSENAWMRC